MRGDGSVVLVWLASCISARNNFPLENVKRTKNGRKREENIVQTYFHSQQE